MKPVTKILIEGVIEVKYKILNEVQYPTPPRPFAASEFVVRDSKGNILKHYYEEGR